MMDRKRSGEKLNLAIFLLLSSVLVYSQEGQAPAIHQEMQHHESMVATMKILSDPWQQTATTSHESCARFEEGSIVQDPPILSSHNGVLEVDFDYRTMTDIEGLTRYCYLANNHLQAPILQVYPGDLLTIHFHNNLPPAMTVGPMTGMLMPSPPQGGPCRGGIMTGSSTNIHFHGMNVPPTCHQDDVIHTLIQPGEEFDYKLRIPWNEPPGLYWYHPHPHGFTEPQTLGGASGPIIVKGIESVNPKLAGLQERVLVVRDQILPGDESNDPAAPAKDLSLNYVPVPYPDYPPAVIMMRPSEIQFWRFLNASADTILDLQLLFDGAPQPLGVVAFDGVPLLSPSGVFDGSIRWMNHILLPPAGRVEFIMKGPSEDVETATLITRRVPTGPDGDNDPERPLATIRAIEDAPEPPLVSHARHLRAAPPMRFVSLTNAKPLRQRTLYFSEVLQDPNDPDSPTTFLVTVDGQTPEPYDPSNPPNIIVHDGTVEDWIVQNRSKENHEFHIHQLHFMLLERNGKRLKNPELRDTVDIPYWSGHGPYPSVKIRLDFRDPEIVGLFVYHCHIAEHEDGGMMGAIKVLPATLSEK